MYSYDVDGDGDNDVLWASFSNGFVAWHENMDGAGTFGPRQIIASQVDPLSVVTADVDGDGDMDVITLMEDYGPIIWFENRNMQKAFWTVNQWNVWVVVGLPLFVGHVIVG